MQLTQDQVISLAPDAASVKAGRGLSGPAKWVSYGRYENVLWGECKGSGKKPYQTRADLADTAFKCTCPSRKFPCKHALGLMFLYASDPTAFKTTDTPDWVIEWVETRKANAEKKQVRAEEKAQKQADPEAKAKREGKRHQQIQQGLEDLNTWLQDRLRAGFAELPQQPHSFWSEPAARLVDAQAPALAAFFDTMQDIVIRRADGWPEALLAQMGKLKLIIEAFSRYDTLSSEQQADLRAVLGWALDKDEVLLSGEALSDQWFVQAVSYQDNQQLRERRTWLQGVHSGRAALLLDFAYGTQPFKQHLLPGTWIQAELAFYPSAYPLRAILKDSPQPLEQDAPIKLFEHTGAALQSYAQALAKNPWLSRYPLCIQDLVPWHNGEQIGLCDQRKHVLPIDQEFKATWELLALSGGQPLAVFGEWQGDCWLPLAAWHTDGSSEYAHFGGLVQ